MLHFLIRANIHTICWNESPCTVAIWNKSRILQKLSHSVSHFVITVAFYNKTVAFCNKKADASFAYCNKIAVGFCSSICDIFYESFIMNQIWNLVSSTMLMLCWMFFSPSQLEGECTTDPLPKRNPFSLETVL